MHDKSRIAFKVLAIYAVIMGLVTLPACAFVGPHLLLAAFGHLLVGVSAAVANYGLRHRTLRVWGWWTGVAVSVTVIMASTIAIRQLLPSDGGLPASVYFSITGLLFSAVLVDLLRNRHPNHTKDFDRL